MVEKSDVDNKQDRFGEHAKLVLRAFAQGRLIPFLGAGANDPIENWVNDSPCLPLGGQLAKHLSEKFLPASHVSNDLAKVAQHITLIAERGPLRTELHQLLNRDYPIPATHGFLARIPSLLRRTQCPRPNLLVITTNYDDLMERAFDLVREEYEVLTYISDGKDRGRFEHTDRYGETRLVARPNQYTGVSTAKSNVVLKLHGAVRRANEYDDSYVISEDDYIEYLAHTNPSQLVPAHVLEQISNSGFLFIGYALRDWNMRVILHRLSQARKWHFRSWAIQRSSSELDAKFWESRKIDIFEANLCDYIPLIEQHFAGIIR